MIEGADAAASGAPDHPQTARAGRHVEAEIVFAQGGGRTFIQRQSVPYPFHITRPLYLDGTETDCATLYLQSASGGLYRGDRLRLNLSASAGATAHVTSQAATVVHTTAGAEIGVTTRITVAAHAFLAVTTDPYILFPDTALIAQTDVSVAQGASAIVAEGFAAHDPAGRGLPFKRLTTACRVRTDAGRSLVQDAGGIDGAAFAAQDSPLGAYRAMGSVMILGEAALKLDPGRIEHKLDSLAVLAGATLLPNHAGYGVRLLAADGGHLARGLDAVFAIGFEGLLGTAPARRRK